MAMSFPGTGSGLPAGPAAPGELAVPISSSPALSSAGITMATRRPGPARHQRGRDQRDASAPAVARRSAVPGTPSGSAAGDGQVRPGRRRPSRAIEALPVAMPLPGTGSGLLAGLQPPVSSRYPPADRRRRQLQGASSPALAIEQQRAHFPLWCPIRVVQLHLVRTWCAPGERARDLPLQGLARVALDAAGRPAPSRRGPWPRLSLVPDPGCRQACSTG